MSELKLSKVFGITEDGRLIILEPVETVKVKEESKHPVSICDYSLGHGEMIATPHYYTIGGNIKTYHIIKDGAQIFEKSIQEVVDQEIDRLNAIKKIMRGD